MNLLKNLFFLCIACDAALNDSSETDSSFPLCQSCFQSLIPCPPLCKNCGGPVCITQSECTQPWLSRPEIQSYSARYIFYSTENDPGYKVLRRWKIQRGILLDRKLLTPLSELQKH